MRRMLLLRCFSLLWLVSSSAALKVSLEGTVATLDLHAGDEFVAPRRSLLGCAATGDDDDEDDDQKLVRVPDVALERLGMKLGPWAKVMPWLATKVALWRRRRRTSSDGGHSALARFAATRRVTVRLGAAKPGWGSRLVRLEANETLVAKAGAVACAVGPSLANFETSSSSSGRRGDDAFAFLRCRGPGTVALAAPGAVLKMRGTTLDVDERRLIGWTLGGAAAAVSGTLSSSSSSSSLSSSEQQQQHWGKKGSPRLASYAGVRWRSFPGFDDVYAAAAVQEPPPIVVVQRQSAQPHHHKVLVPGRRSGVLHGLLRRLVAVPMASLLFLTAVALLRCNFHVDRFVRTFVLTVSDARFFLRKLAQTIALIYVDVRTALTEPDNDAWGPL